MDEKYNEAIDLYMAGKYDEAIAAMAQSKSVTAEVYKQFVQQCRQLSLENGDVPQPTIEDQAKTPVITEPEQPITNKNARKSFKMTKDKILSGVIALLILANLTVVFFWVKNCLQPKSVMDGDMEMVERFISEHRLSNQVDSISYAVGCFTAENHMQSSAAQIFSLREIDRQKMYAGMYRASITPNFEQRREILNECFQNMINATIDEHSKVGKLDGDIIFQGIVDVATTGRNPILSIDEFGEISRNSFDF